MGPETAGITLIKAHKATEHTLIPNCTVEHTFDALGFYHILDFQRKIFDVRAVNNAGVFISRCPVGNIRFITQILQKFHLRPDSLIAPFKGVAAGGVVATATGLMQLMARIDYGTKVPDFLSKETLDKMYTQINAVDTDGDKAQYALGWRTGYSNYPDWKAFHGGTLAGVCPIWARSYDNVNGVILCNSRSYDKSIDSDMWHLLEDLQDMCRR